MSLMWRKSGLVNHAEIHDMFMFKFSTEIWTLKLHQVFISMFTLASPWFSCRFGQGKSPKLGCNSPVNTSRIPILSLSFRPYPSKRLHGWETEQLYINMGCSTLCLGDGWKEEMYIFLLVYCIWYFPPILKMSTCSWQLLTSWYYTFIISLYFWKCIVLIDWFMNMFGNFGGKFCTPGVSLSQLGLLHPWDISMFTIEHRILDYSVFHYAIQNGLKQRSCNNTHFYFYFFWWKLSGEIFAISYVIRVFLLQQNGEWVTMPAKNWAWLGAVRELGIHPED